MIAKITSLLLAALLALSGSTASYTVPWWTVDSGGGLAAGGGYALGGSIGQPDAGLLHGGEYTLSGGFWGQSAPQMPPGPTALYLPMLSRQACRALPYEAEPNNTPADANRLCSNRPLSGHHDGSQGSGDLFVISLSAGQQVEASLDTADVRGVQALLYRPDGANLELLVQDAVPPFAFTYTVEASGMYYLYVYSDPGADNTAAYTLLASTGGMGGLMDTSMPASSIPPPAPPQDHGGE